MKSLRLPILQIAKTLMNNRWVLKQYPLNFFSYFLSAESLEFVYHGQELTDMIEVSSKLLDRLADEDPALIPKAHLLVIYGLILINGHDSRWSRILYRRFIKRETLAKISEAEHITRERVRQLQMVALSYLWHKQKDYCQFCLTAFGFASIEAKLTLPTDKELKAIMQFDQKLGSHSNWQLTDYRQTFAKMQQH